MAHLDRNLTLHGFHCSWYHIYLLLAVPTVVTLLLTFYLNHSSNEIFANAIHENSVWFERLDKYNQLEKLAATVNRPGNDVFHSRNIAGEERHLQIATRRFLKLWDGYYQEISLLENHKDLLQHEFLAIRSAMRIMIHESELIFQYLRANKEQRASARMAIMDRCYAKLMDSIGKLRNSVMIILSEDLALQHQRSERLRWLEYAAFLLVMVMVLGMGLYGRCLSLGIKTQTKDRNSQLAKLTHMKKALELSEQRIKKIAMYAPVGIFETDVSGNCLFVNDCWCSIAGISKAQAYGSGWSYAIHPEDRERVYQQWYLAATSHQPFVMEYRFKHIDGTVTWVHGTAAAILSAEGAVAGYIGCLTDISKLKEIERNLEHSRDAAETATRSKSEFLANMSHEIRTPMNGVIGMTELLLDSELDANQRELAETVKSSAAALLTVINDILDFSKVEAGKLELVAFPTDLSLLVKSIEKLMALALKEKLITFTVEIGAQVPLVTMVDGDRLRQVLINLIGNAIKFTPEHGAIELKIQAELNPQSDKARYHFEVIDTGIGIPYDRQQQVFDAFVQADGSTSRQYGGTGLGLTISSHLIRLLGGALNMNSEPSKGTKFYFDLELAHSDISILEWNQGAIVNKTFERLSRSLSVLVAEDNVVNQKLALKILQKAGHQVTLAANGKEAVEKSAAKDFDIILMDIQMPIMNGHDATQKIRLREQGSSRRVPIVALTANAMRGEREKYLSLGMDGYVTKPFDRESLFDVIAKVMGENTIRISSNWNRLTSSSS